MSSTHNRYFDNATTSFPKPRAVADAVSRYITENSGSYGRAAYRRVVDSTAAVERCRDLLADAMGVADAEKVFFTANATVGANTILRGLPLAGKTVWVSPMEHNAVMRPLDYLSEAEGIIVKILPSDANGRIDVENMKTLPIVGAGLIVINHQSNVNGVVQPIVEIVRAVQGVPVVLDLSQSLGAVDVALDDWGVDYAFFTGHKSLLGTNGAGGFFARRPETVRPLIYGGTGSNSDSYAMPSGYPDRFEAGTHNISAIIALGAALENRPSPQHSPKDFLEFSGQVARIDGVKLYFGENEKLFSITHRTLSPSELCSRLFVGYGIETRQGLHCAPLAHRTLGTFPNGTVRVSVSPYHTVADFEYFLNSLRDITVGK